MIIDMERELFVSGFVLGSIFGSFASAMLFAWLVVKSTKEPLSPEAERLRKQIL